MTRRVRRFHLSVALLFLVALWFFIDHYPNYLIAFMVGAAYMGLAITWAAGLLVDLGLWKPWK